MADREFKIKIITSAEGSGAKQTAGELDDLSGKTAAHTENLKGMDEWAKKTDLSHRELRYGLSMISPELGHVAHGMMLLEAGITGGLLLAVAGLVKGFETLTKAGREMAETQAAMKTAVWEEQVKSIGAAKQAADEYAGSLKKIWEAVDTLKTHEEQELAVLKAIEAARMKILEAQEAAELASVKGDPVAEAAVRARYKEKKSDEELAAEADEIAQKEKFAAEQAAAEKAAAVKLDAAERAKEKGAPGGDEAAMATARLAAHKDDVAKAQLELEKIGPSSFWRAEAERTKDVVNESGENPSELFARQSEAAEKKLATAQAAQVADQAAVDAHTKAQDKLNKAVEQATTAYKKAFDTREATDASIAQAKAVFGIHQTASKAAAAIEQGSELAAAGFRPGSRLGATLLGDIKAEEGRAHGDQMSAPQATGITQLVTALRAAGNSQQQINAIIKDMMDLHLSHDAKLRELAAALNQVKGQVKGMANQ